MTQVQGMHYQRRGDELSGGTANGPGPMSVGKMCL